MKNIHNGNCSELVTHENAWCTWLQFLWYNADVLIIFLQISFFRPSACGHQHFRKNLVSSSFTAQVMQHYAFWLIHWSRTLIQVLLKNCLSFMRQDARIPQFRFSYELRITRFVFKIRYNQYGMLLLVYWSNL